MIYWFKIHLKHKSKWWKEPYKRKRKYNLPPPARVAQIGPAACDIQAAKEAGPASIRQISNSIITGKLLGHFFSSFSLFKQNFRLRFHLGLILWWLFDLIELPPWALRIDGEYDDPGDGAPRDHLRECPYVHGEQISCNSWVTLIWLHASIYRCFLSSTPAGLNESQIKGSLHCNMHMHPLVS